MALPAGTTTAELVHTLTALFISESGADQVTAIDFATGQKTVSVAVADELGERGEINSPTGPSSPSEHGPAVLAADGCPPGPRWLET